MEKRMFAGASTPLGFVNFFEFIMPLEKAQKRYLLKGSSGSGKSTFIKKVAKEFEVMGEYIEKFHCSNDVKSLDALAIPSRGLCIIDATAPHAKDPEIPIAIDKIIDFAEFIDESKIAKYKDELRTLLNAKKAATETATEYFKALGSIYKAENSVYETPEKKQDLKKEAKELVSQLNLNLNELGIDRKLFLNALTPDGFVSFSDRYFSDCEVYNVPQKNIDLFLAELRSEANFCGINTESFYSPFAPNKLQHLYLPEAKIVFTSKEQNKSELFEKILNTTVTSMKESRSHHLKIEEIYKNTIDFKKLNAMTEKIIQEILQ